jgi:Zn-dependent metalloprotease
MKSGLSQARAVEMARLAARVEGALRGEPVVRQVVYAEEGTPVKAWEVVLPSREPLGDFEVVIDASSGKLLSLVNLIKHAEAKAKVFNPNPVIALKNNTLRDNNDADSAAFSGAYSDVILQGLDNPRKLKGQFVEITANTVTEEEVDAAAGFNFKRNQKGFEGVMVYYHIDRIQRYFQSIGIKNANNRVQKVDPHGTSDDNSWYSPMSKELTFGDGGVDDAEDADIIAHEYGHSTQDNQCPGFGRTNEGGAMGEGFSDYLASTMRADLTFQKDVVGSWDATAYSNAPEPALRRMDSTKHYPEDMQGQVHADGEIWAAVLWQVWNKIGKEVCDKIVMESHFSLSPQSQFADGANALIQADQNLFGGAHVEAIKAVFVERGIMK